MFYKEISFEDAEVSVQDKNASWAFHVFDDSGVSLKTSPFRDPLDVIGVKCDYVVMYRPRDRLIQIDLSRVEMLPRLKSWISWVYAHILQTMWTPSQLKTSGSWVLCTECTYDVRDLRGHAATSSLSYVHVISDDFKLFFRIFSGRRKDWNPFLEKSRPEIAASLLPYREDSNRLECSLAQSLRPD